MKIEHIGLWVKDLEKMQRFYVKYFQAVSGPLYRNSQKQFTSYFLAFESGSRLELMHRDDIGKKNQESLGYAHMAFSVGSERDVNTLVKRLQGDGFPLLNGPRRTGDGYYEAVMLDPEDNRIEIMAD